MKEALSYNTSNGLPLASRMSRWLLIVAHDYKALEKANKMKEIDNVNLGFYVI
jgi:hypothetical protein